MNLNGRMLKNEFVRFAVIIILVRSCTDMGTCALAQNGPMSQFEMEESALYAKQQSLT